MADVEELTRRIADQGDAVRKLKTEGASKEDVGAAVCCRGLFFIRFEFCSLLYANLTTGI
jgi:hypothetical protein